MAIVSRGFVEQTGLRDAVTNAVDKLPQQEVVRVLYDVGVDSTGEPAIFFRVVLTDAASREATLADVTGRVATILFDEVRPYEKWGLTPYFSFRSQSEQAQRYEPEWS